MATFCTFLHAENPNKDTPIPQGKICFNPVVYEQTFCKNDSVKAVIPLKYKNNAWRIISCVFEPARWKNNPIKEMPLGDDIHKKVNKVYHQEKQKEELSWNQIFNDRIYPVWNALDTWVKCSACVAAVIFVVQSYIKLRSCFI